MNIGALSLHTARQALVRLTLVLSLVLIWALGATKPTDGRGPSLPGAATASAQTTDWAAVQVKSATTPRANDDRGLNGPEPFLTARHPLPATASHGTGQVQATGAPALRAAHHRPQAPRAPPTA